METTITKETELKAIDAEVLAKTYDKYAISTVVEYENSAQDLKKVKGKYKELDELRKSMTAPLDTSKKKIMDFFRKPLDFLLNAENTIKLAMRKFQQEQERKRREEEIRLAELARKEAERLQKRAEKASKKGQAEKAEALQQQALETEMMKPIVQSEVPKVAGIGSRESWKFRIVDIDLIPREFMTPNLQRIGEVARTTKGTLKIPGIKFYKEDIITSRT